MSEMEDTGKMFHRWLSNESIPDLKIDTLLDLHRIETIVRERQQTIHNLSPEIVLLIEQYAALLDSLIRIQKARDYFKDIETRRMIEESE